MHRPPSASVQIRLLCLLLGLLVIPIFTLHAGTPPAWWSQRGATNTNPANDSATANLGQLKLFASKAAAELNANLLGGAGTTINNLITTWQQPPAQGVVRNDYAALTVGQLKSVAKPFYDRLIAQGFATSYPWTSTLADDNDTAAANLGQLKKVFDFTLITLFESPTGLTATSGNAQIVLSWFPVSGATSYKVLRSSINGGPYAEFTGNTTTSPTITLTNTGLSNGTRYYYVAQVSNGGSYGASSAQTSAVPGVDSDSDGMPDWWESQYGITDPLGNPDGDSLNNLQEYQMGSNPLIGADVSTSAISLLVFTKI